MIKQKSRWLIITLGVVIGLILLIIIPLLHKTYIFQAFKMPSGSMKPTLLIGDYFFADKTYANTKNVERGDVIIFEFPKDHSKIFIKRVIGLPGDHLEIKGKQVYINKALLEEAYVIHTDDRIFDASFGPRDNLGPILVPDNSYFVLGDNRDESNDSRFWGFLKASEIKGRAGRIYWSWDRTTHRARWRRIGNPVL
jgi:signal peptidase I